jgi:phosphatidylglycerophosphate synthase
MTPRTRRWIAIGALAVGIALFAIALAHADLGALARLPRQLGASLLVALVPGAVWHVLRTEAWRRAFPPRERIPFARAFRVRIAAEAVSYVTISGLAGDPLKVVLLGGEVAPAAAASAVAIERVAYIFVTAVIMASASSAIAAGMPLQRAWTWVFAATGAFALAIVALLVALVLRHRDTGRVASSTIARWLRRLSVDVTALVSERRRFAALVALECAAYVMMVSEVWTILWAAGVPVAFTRAGVIETFTRAASMAAAVIPANIGALEASNLAAAAAVHAGAGGLALALVRRVRGLAWCAAGLILYPRRRTTPAPHAERTLLIVDAGDRPLLLSARLGGLPAAERVVRAAARAGYTRALVWTAPDRAAAWRRESRADIAVTAAHDRDEWPRYIHSCDATMQVTVLAPAIVPSPALLESARTISPDTLPDRGIVHVPAGPAHPHSGVLRAHTRDVLEPDHLIEQLRPIAEASMPSGEDASAGRARLSMHVATEKEAALAERQLRASIFKPTDGRLARLNRRCSVPISLALIRSVRLHPNAMSLALTALGLYAAWLFSRGAYVAGIVGALLSWVASMLDGCDGELARFQYKESAFGCWLDTIGDYVYYVALFAGITIGVMRTTAWPGFVWVGAALGVGMLLTFALLIVLRWGITGGRPEQLRVRALDHFEGSTARWKRVVAELETFATRASMPYGIVAFAVFNVLPALVVLAAFTAQAYWIVLATQAGSLLRQHRSTREPSQPDGIRVVGL